MAADGAENGDVPPAGEAIHLPDPSYLPVIVAAGTTIALVGVVIAWYVLAIGTVMAVIGIVRWVGQTRREMGELPLSHDS